MNTMREALQNYLDMRRALGFKLSNAGPALSDFVSFLQRKRTACISIPLALKWAQKPDVQPATWANRLAMVRGFARYRSATDPRTEIPPGACCRSDRNGRTRMCTQTMKCACC